jgi:thioredoxin reductase
VRRLLVPITLHQRSGLAEQLGATVGAAGPLSADSVIVDARFATDVPGLFAAGDTSTLMPSVAAAVATGSAAAAMVVGDLMLEPAKRQRQAATRCQSRPMSRSAAG